VGPSGAAVAADHVVKQHTVIISADNSTLFAINAADNSISTFLDACQRIENRQANYQISIAIDEPAPTAACASRLLP